MNTLKDICSSRGPANTPEKAASREPIASEESAASREPTVAAEKSTAAPEGAGAAEADRAAAKSTVAPEGAGAAAADQAEAKRAAAAQELAASVTKALIERGLTISFMESCTSGLLASMLTDTEGASAVFPGSFVTYSNSSKIRSGVSPEVIDRYGVYSKECAREMAEAVLRAFGTGISVGITGTTGNKDPNNADSSVTGEVFFCIIYNDMVFDHHIKADVSAMERKDIKQYYADEVYLALFELVGKPQAQSGRMP